MHSYPQPFNKHFEEETKKCVVTHHYMHVYKKQICKQVQNPCHKMDQARLSKTYYNVQQEIHKYPLPQKAMVMG